ncbi:DUF484 family protein [Sphingomonas sp. ID0503]|uniref:DUF484 family protein n=1 Tax=Sphingomonas sp. ID0503 TaxID=3399691 RepID=UPI003AFA2EBC
MATVIDFGPHAMASLRARVAAVEEVNRDLLAFARGHSGAVSAIHGAVLEAMGAEDLEHLIHIVTQVWPDTLGLDAVAIGLVSGGSALRADAGGHHAFDPDLLAHVVTRIDPVILRNVGRGHPLFGPAADLIAAEALVRLEDENGQAIGVLLLGQRRAQGFENRAGSELLIFLGASISRMIGRWLTA